MQLQAALSKANPALNQEKVMNNLVYLAHKLEEIARGEKQFRRKTRSFIFSLTHFLWGWDLNTKKRHCAEEAMRDLKRGHWDKLVAYCATGENSLGLEFDLMDFSIKETRQINAPSLAAVTPAAAQALVIPSHPMPATPNFKVSGALSSVGVVQSKDSPGEDPSVDPVVRSAAKPNSLAAGLFGVSDSSAVPVPLPSAPPSAPFLYPSF